MIFPCMWASGAWCEGDVWWGVLLGLEASFAVVIMVVGSRVRFIDVSWWASVYCLLSADWACLGDVFPLGVVAFGA